ncbi:hypothetical protein IMZ11_02065 [Microtetraspora sp. AC03309]|uniref:hypothetical protein n=1 Tax=Microtetraspora sp. AC03309 TaxID=2779376 RepID=UPI001E5C8BF3|nr:hypothetical protein [Microtetraspora sp. AC03309]MCC5574425.1 hypothetical protein [Microtetraspora sp. AC03309]
MAPVWIHDHQMAGVADRFLDHPPPPETSISSTDYHGSVGAYDMKDMCTFRLRFDLSTTLSLDEIAGYYRAAGIRPSEGGNDSLEFMVWESPHLTGYRYGVDDRPVIVEIQDRDHGSFWDLRCM